MPFHLQDCITTQMSLAISTLIKPNSEIAWFSGTFCLAHKKPFSPINFPGHYDLWGLSIMVTKIC